LPDIDWSMRFGILRKPVPGKIETVGDILHACVLLHNYLAPYTIEAEDRLTAQMLQTEEDNLSFPVTNPAIHQGTVSFKTQFAADMFHDYVQER